MFTNSVEQSKKLLDTMWGNWENGVQKIYESQQEFGKISVEAIKKQQEMFTTLTSNLKQVEEEMKTSLNKVTQSFKENNKYLNNEEAASLLESWNEKMADIINRIQQLSATPSKAMLTMVEQSHERMYESVKKAVEEQNKIQTESKEVIEKFMSQIKESQSKWVDVIEGQTTQTLEKLQPK
ncbi:hypothetical protein BGM26_20075 [Bacillus sp. FJAT-29790]|uniref:hypothetical protein n=1 Tax=Bacillus sp. FJAT-29790 TaxID=1895002 RepID=UPI001C242FC8|nr:hypothetical protein [Bacillus sp. FJAT-29790]MBU8881224.1 hypothetical protein [Bacillus sp. FJAT-29790]